MYVIKRNGQREPVHFDKITERIRVLVVKDPPIEGVDPVVIAQKVIMGVYAGVTTKQLDMLAMETAAALCTVHPGYAALAGRLAVSNMHKETNSDYSVVVDRLYNYVNPKTGERAPLIAEDVYDLLKANMATIQRALEYHRDYNYDYFGYKTLERSYLLRLEGEVVERPQHLLMRVAFGIHKADVASVLETYKLMSQGWYTHATPTLFNAGTPNPQMSSCFLLTMNADSIEGIYETLKQCALISKSAGGIGLSVHTIRASQSYIRGTNGTSNGLVPMLRVFNDTARYVDQGGGKRKGAFAVYLEPWHADVEDFLDLKKNHGKEEQRARDLFYGLWVPDLFMRRVEANADWSLFCPNECRGLADCWGEEFERLYERYEKEGRARKTVKAQDLWFRVVDSQIETGTPYILYKDSCNRKSNQQNLGTIRSSNLCTEIIEYTAPDEIAVCNLASIALPRYVVKEEGRTLFDFDRLREVAYHVTRNLNRVIDGNFYPVPQARKSNMRHRPVGLGVQGLADTFCLLRLPFTSPEAKLLNRDIFETIYYGALQASCDLAAIEGPYETYPGSPASKGQLQPDLWGVATTSRWDWAALRSQIAKHGLRNSLLIAPMPTASTSQILGNNECFEPFTSNLYSRRVLAGEFVVVNQYLLRDLLARGLWNDAMKNRIVAAGGSIQGIAEIPQDLQELYKTVWELPQRDLVDMAADRGAFIDQSQSFNVFMATPTRQKITSMHYYGWKKGLKTGMYYLRTKPAAQAIQFTVDPSKLKAPAAQAPLMPIPDAAPAAALAPETAPQEIEVEGDVCRMEEGCLVCGS